MKVALFTPTRGRPRSFALVEHCIKKQTYKGDYIWVVVNDGDEGYNYKCGQEVICRRRRPRELHSLCSNTLKFFEEMEDQVDAVVVLEDDDWYSPTYLESLVEALEKEPLVGFAPERYWNLKYQGYREFRNRGHCSFGASAFTKELFEVVRVLAHVGKPILDLPLWRSWSGGKKILDNEVKGEEWQMQHVGLKATPGTLGIASGHKTPGVLDEDHGILRNWIGKDSVFVEDMINAL